MTPPSIRPDVITAYTQSLRWVYIIGVPLGGFCLLLALLVKNINLKTAGPVRKPQASTISTDGNSEQGSDILKKEAPGADEKKELQTV